MIKVIIKIAHSITTAHCNIAMKMDRGQGFEPLMMEHQFTTIIINSHERGVKQ